MYAQERRNVIADDALASRDEFFFHDGEQLIGLDLVHHCRGNVAETEICYSSQRRIECARRNMTYDAPDPGFSSLSTSFAVLLAASRETSHHALVSIVVCEAVVAIHICGCKMHLLNPLRAT